MSKQDYGTPAWIIEELGPFDLDVAASPENAKAPKYYTEAQDGLTQLWREDRVWCNPPYKNIMPWVKRVSTDLLTFEFIELFLLVPATPSTAWFKKAYDLCTGLWFADHRLKFDGGASTARQDHCIFYFNPEGIGEKTVFIGENLTVFKEEFIWNYR